jgi:hypothetical protein
MNVLELCERRIEDTDPFWLGKLSMSIALAVPRVGGDVRDDLEQTLADFLHSPLPSEELKRTLREEMGR